MRESTKYMTDADGKKCKLMDSQYVSGENWGVLRSAFSNNGQDCRANGGLGSRVGKEKAHAKKW